MQETVFLFHGQKMIFPKCACCAGKESSMIPVW